MFFDRFFRNPIKESFKEYLWHVDVEYLDNDNVCLQIAGPDYITRSAPAYNKETKQWHLELQDGGTMRINNDIVRYIVSTRVNKEANN